jgi:hypothetical protein
MDWQSIETAPEHTDVLVWQGFWPRIIVAKRGSVARGNADRWYANNTPTAEPSHWMPLPEPPK